MMVFMDMIDVKYGIIDIMYRRIEEVGKDNDPFVQKTHRLFCNFFQNDFPEKDGKKRDIFQNGLNKMGKKVVMIMMINVSNVKWIRVG